MALLLARSVTSGPTRTVQRRRVAPSRSVVRPVAYVGASKPDDIAQFAPPDCVRVTLQKPIGVVFEQGRAGGPVFVSEVTPGGHAAKSGVVAVGDILTACSAVYLYKGTDALLYAHDGPEERPYDKWEAIEFDCDGQDFKTVMAALHSNNTRLGKTDITLVLRKP
ncbi:hypothetical protein HYH03_001364 [Edaphochlamys debaryana]|uniref:PDZ domain-containing protein n=1 Tax=Edaphochlamys debaryana TaxID=47281 RepID=A0A835YDH8_9CHLO|nr:hypothetical protein HYH03_001364 [Edaphochlamys debaryana]|eukprot:KAG2500596.1 hypothetical protein HYH03_001364 [Edaphochlamys debaryana]